MEGVKGFMHVQIKEEMEKEPQSTSLISSTQAFQECWLEDELALKKEEVLDNLTCDPVNEKDPLAIEEKDFTNTTGEEDCSTDMATKEAISTTHTSKECLLEDHLVVKKEEDTDEHPNKCKYCRKIFKKPSDLVRHERTHTGERPYRCSYCNKSFTIKSTLESHLNTHGSQKTFWCSVCGSYFSTKGSLKVHMRIHTGARPFKCAVCDANFRTSGHLKSHQVSHTKENSRLNRPPSNKLRRQHKKEGNVNVDEMNPHKPENEEVDLDQSSAATTSDGLMS